jgi:hypothetical protein
MLANIFDQHGEVFFDKRNLVGEHVTNELTCFAGLDEMFFHGDKPTTDMVKGLTTADKRTINPKFEAMRKISSMLKLWILSNHTIVMSAGSGARLLVIYIMGDERAYSSDPAKKKENREYFIKLVWAIQNDGASQFLHYLLTLNLPLGWHPRDIIDTEELAEHHHASMPATYRWARTCAQLEEIASPPPPGKLHSYIVYNLKNGKYEPSLAPFIPVGVGVTNADLLKAFREWENNSGERETTTNDQFFKHINQLFGDDDRFPSADKNTTRRPLGAFYPR